MKKAAEKGQKLKKGSTSVCKTSARSPRETERLAALGRKLNQPQPPHLEDRGDGKCGFADDASGHAAMFEALGTADIDLSNLLITQAYRTLFGSDRERIEKCNVVLAALHGIRPRDELEGLLAVQMVGVHNLAMEYMKRAMLQEQTAEGVDTNVNRATKLLRTFTAQIEALHRYRGKGQQKVIVKHVHVNEGGQAIVGNVEGGGVNGKRRG